MVKSDGGNGIFVIDSVGDGFNEGGFSCVLESHDCDFEFFVEESAFDPVNDFIEESQHVDIITPTLHPQILMLIIRNQTEQPKSNKKSIVGMFLSF